MDWIQLVLPTEGMQAAILAYRDSFAKDDDLPQDRTGLFWVARSTERSNVGTKRKNGDGLFCS